MHGGVHGQEATGPSGWRERIERTGDRLVEWLREQQGSPRWVRGSTVVVLTVAAGAINYATGPEASVVLEYVLAVGAAAWLLRGWPVALVVVTCASLSGVILYAIREPDLPGWLIVVNAVLRFVTLSLIAMVIAALRRHVERADRAVQVDALTGCESRRAILTRLEAEVRQAHRHGTPLCVLYLDLDRFKAVNDEYGHAAGDALLRQFTRTVGAHVRERDILGRVGGDEFLLVCPATPAWEAEHLARRLRALPGIAPVSIGVASLRDVDPHGGPHVVASELLARADAAMYAVKPR